MSRNRRTKDEREKRSLRSSSHSSDSESDDDATTLEYSRKKHHPNDITITDWEDEDGVAFYIIEVYSGQPPTMKWVVKKRYQFFLDHIKHPLETLKTNRWKKELQSYDFPKKNNLRTDDKVLEARQKGLELWLNRVLAHAAEIRSEDPKDEGVKLIDDFLAPEDPDTVQPVSEAARVNKDDEFDPEDEREKTKIAQKKKKKARRDPGWKEEAEKRKRKAASPSAGNADDTDSEYSSSDSDEEDTWTQRVDGCVQKCWTGVKNASKQCVAKCQQMYTKVEDEEEDDQDGSDGRRTRPTRAATSPAKLERSR